jgi:hypothetical protein
MPTAITHDPIFNTPVSSTNTAVVRWSGTAGSVLQNSGVLIDGSNNITGIGTIASGAITSSGAIIGTQVDILAAGDLRLQDSTGGQYVALEAAGTTTTHTLTFPATQGSASTVLTNNGSGALTWAAPSGLRGILQMSATGVEGTGAVLHSVNGRGGPTLFGDNSTQQNATFQFAMPSDFSTLQRAIITVYTTSGSNNLSYDVYSYCAANGEIWNTSSDSIYRVTLSLTDEQIMEIDVSSALTNIAASDHVQLVFSRNGGLGADTISTLYVDGLILEWT